MRRGNRFERGSGCYKCGSCGRRTRSTGGDNDSLSMCAECYELGGLENLIADRGETPELLAEIKALEEKIERLKGEKA